MERMPWDEKYSVRIKEIDGLQQKYMEILNRLIDLRNEEAEAKLIADAFADLVEFVRYYCTAEEKMLMRLNYPELEMHKKEHKDLVKAAMKYRRWFAEDPANLTDEVVTYFREWAAIHFRETDFRYGPFIRLQRFLQSYQKHNRRIRPV